MGRGILLTTHNARTTHMIVGSCSRDRQRWHDQYDLDSRSPVILPGLLSCFPSILVELQLTNALKKSAPLCDPIPAVFSKV